MDPVQGARSFQVSGDAYDSFMGRYSRRLADVFIDSLDPGDVASVLDVGCGPGALTTSLVRRFGSSSVVACDPSPSFVADCAERHPGVEVRLGRAEAIPYDDESVDAVLAQLVFHFVSDPELMMSELRRVVRPGGLVAGCVWDFAEGMELLRAFWDAALELDPDAPDEARSLRFGKPGEIVELLDGAGFVDSREWTLRVTSTYVDFDELWAGFLQGIGPAGSYCVGLAPVARLALRSTMFRRLGEPAGPFTLSALARAASARRPT